MVTDEQVKKLMKSKSSGKTLQQSAARSGMDVKTARKYLRLGKLPSERRPERTWRTRADPFAEVWPEVEKILEDSPTAEGKTLFEHLCRKYEGRFQEGQLRTLQRRVKRWRARRGPLQEVMFPQRHEPGRQAQSDFTVMDKLGVRIAGEPFPHLLFHFVLCRSNWESVTICPSESFESLSQGLQEALWELGAVPREHRTYSLSAAVNNLSKREEFTQRYEGLLGHYGMGASHTQAGKAHENGDVEQSHHRFKRAVGQELILRGSRDFASREAYEEFLALLQQRRNAARAKRLAEELAVMRRLPARRVESYTREEPRVSSSSTIQVRKNAYSVDSRLIGELVQVRVHCERLEVLYGGGKVHEMPRLRGSGKHRVNYRHIIHSLVKKPGAFARYRYREDLFPRLLFRVAYDELRRRCPRTGDRQYLQILLLAAEGSEERVEAALGRLIESEEKVSDGRVKELLKQGEALPAKWDIQEPSVSLAAYDGLLGLPAGEARP